MRRRHDADWEDDGSEAWAQMMARLHEDAEGIVLENPRLETPFCSPPAMKAPAKL
eukprot:COSAG05_NODE_267_length_12595_cov_7.076905_3_plen_55_part_00